MSFQTFSSTNYGCIKYVGFIKLHHVLIQNLDLMQLLK